MAVRQYSTLAPFLDFAVDSPCGMPSSSAEAGKQEGASCDHILDGSKTQADVEHVAQPQMKLRHTNVILPGLRAFLPPRHVASNEPCVSEEEGERSSTKMSDTPESGPRPICPGTGTVQESLRTPGFHSCGELSGLVHRNAVGVVIQGYETRIGRLERQCLEVLAENQVLRQKADSDRMQASRVMELNFRLSHEVRQLRQELSAASGRAEQMAMEAQSARHERVVASNKLRQARRGAAKMARIFPESCDNQTETALEQLVKAAEAPGTLAPAAGRLHPAAKCTSTDDSSVQPAPQPESPVKPSDTESAEIEELSVDSGAETLNPSDLLSDGSCNCGDENNWGCLPHAVYSRALMLVHHTLAVDLARGPPGLEFLSPGRAAPSAVDKLGAVRLLGCHQAELARAHAS